MKYLQIVSATLMGMTVYSLLNALLNYLFTWKKVKHNPDWSYQNKEICKKTYKVNLFTGIFSLISSVALLLISL